MVKHNISYVLLFTVIINILSVPIYASEINVDLPSGFKINEFAGDLGSPRFMALSPDGVLFTTDITGGRVLALPSTKDKNTADSAVIYLDDLKRPHGIAFHDGYLYIGEIDQIVRFKYDGYQKKPGRKEILIPDIPTKGHFTRTVGFGDDGKMYVSIGSSCNVCEERNETRATIMQYDPDGSNGRVYAKGLRNSVGIRFHPDTGEMWATDNGRDWLGDDLPPDEINIVKDKKDYGWPYCYGDNIPDPKYDDKARCESTVDPVYKLQAHSAPLGLEFYTGDMFPSKYKGDLFVAYHGSWNRSVPTGYKVVRIKMDGNKPKDLQDFASGWLVNDKVAWGRPVDVVTSQDGGLYVSDDKAGKIYKITYSGKNN